MASLRQIEANRQNAGRSTGPKSAEGKARSRANAIKHGLAGDATVADELRAEFEGRKAEWREQIRPTTPEGEFALDRAVAATLRIERCDLALNAAMADQVGRACLAWDGDRGAEAAKLADRLARKPEVVARQLETTRHGVELKLGRWERLRGALDAGEGAWSPEQVSTALDLLGIARHLRDGRAPFDPIDRADDPRESRRSFVGREMSRLEAMRSALSRLDELERSHAEEGLATLRSKEAALILRYEREAWRLYEAMLAAAKADAGAKAEPKPEAEVEPVAAAKADAGAKAEVELVAAAQPEPAAVAGPDADLLVEADVDEIPYKQAAPHPTESHRGSMKPERKLNRRQRRAIAAAAGRR